VQLLAGEYVRKLAQAMDEQLLPVACLVKPGILE
jgi:hypothetical protein